MAFGFKSLVISAGLYIPAKGSIQFSPSSTYFFNSSAIGLILKVHLLGIAHSLLISILITGLFRSNSSFYSSSNESGIVQRSPLSVLDPGSKPLISKNVDNGGYLFHEPGFPGTDPCFCAGMRGCLGVIYIWIWLFGIIPFAGINPVPCSRVEGWASRWQIWR